jgi:hypothetical protein
MDLLQSIREALQAHGRHCAYSSFSPERSNRVYMRCTSGWKIDR